ncbi:KH domain-containing protein [Zea mays]|uniref:KH domain-containing protein n=1 Tax=Zea mays TaxID=4577 RepID=A0A1D6QQ67_MAIZE|nr:KH domain-containing protein [Zea mays]AQK59676.1 KH domain-containing protein [Zea mays]
MVICSLGLILGHRHSMVHLSNLMVATPQHLVVIRLDGISLKTSNLIQLPLVLGMIIIVSSSNLSNNLPLGQLLLLMPLATIMVSLRRMLHRDMILPTLSRVVGSKHMDMMATLVTRPKGSSRATLSRLVMISRVMAHLLMDQLQARPRMGPTMVVLEGPVRHLQGSKHQTQLLEANLAIPANRPLVLQQLTHLKVQLHLDMALHHPSLAMAPNHHSKPDMVRALMGSLLHRARNLLHCHLMDRLRLLVLLRLVTGSMVTANLLTVHHQLTLVHPLQATRAMASSLMAMLMVVQAMGSLQPTLLKQHLLLHPRITLLPLLRPLEQQLRQLLKTVGAPKHPLKLELQQLIGNKHFPRPCRVVSSALLLNIITHLI